MEQLEILLKNLHGLFDSMDDYVQWGCIGLSLIIAWLLRRSYQLFLDKTETRLEAFCKSAFKNFGGLKVYPVFLTCMLAISVVVLSCTQQSVVYVQTAMYLVLAYCVYNLLSVFSRGHYIPRLVGGVLYVIIAPVSYTHLTLPTIA